MLELSLVKTETLAQDGTVINTEETTSDFPLQAQYNMISERKRLTFCIDILADGYNTLELPEALLYINFALFLPIGFIYNEPSGPPQAGFNVKLPATINAGTRREMFFYVNGLPESEPNRNLRCFFIGTDIATQFYIELEYYNTADENTYFNYQTKNNQWRFLSEYVGQENFNEIPNSVYHMEKELRCMIYIDSNYVGKQEFSLITVSAKTFNVPSTFEFGADGFTEISTSVDTPVRVLIKSAGVFDSFYIKLIKDKNDTSVDFVTNYDIQENRIQAGQPDNIIKGPFEHNSIFIEGVAYNELIFNIDHTLVEPGQQYRMIGTAYEAYSTDSIAFVSAQIAVQKLFPYSGDGINFTGSLSDVQREFFGDELTCVIEERIRSKMYLDYSYDMWKNDVFNRLGLVVSNDIRQLLQFVKVEIYEEYYDSNVAGTVINLLKQSTLNKTGPNTFVGTDISATFNVDNAELEYTFRNNNDVNGLPISTTVNGVPYYNAFNPIGNQYWGGKDLFIKWRFGFVYPTFNDNIDYIQKLHVKDYDAGIEITRVGSSSYYVCPDKSLCYRAEVTAAIPDYDSEEWLLINTIESVVLPILEEEAFNGPELPQETNQYIFQQDTLYHAPGVRGEWCVDASLLTTNQSFKFSAMAKKNYT